MADTKPARLYAYISNDETGYWGYLSSLPPVVGTSVLLDQNGTTEGPNGGAEFEFGGYYTNPYGDTVTVVSGDTITVNAYVSPL